MFVDASNSFLPEELHTLAMDSLVSCIPNRDIDEHYTLFRIFGPFKSNFPCEMPLFMALQLKVKIEIPIHYKNQEMDKMIKKERSTELAEKLPHDHYFEIGFILKYNIKKLNDYRNVRFDKAMKLVNKMHPNVIRFGYLTAYESNFIRPIIMPLLCYLSYANPGDIGDLNADNVKKRYNDKVSQIQEE